MLWVWAFDHTSITNRQIDVEPPPSPIIFGLWTAENNSLLAEPVLFRNNCFWPENWKGNLATWRGPHAQSMPYSCCNNFVKVLIIYVNMCENWNRGDGWFRCFTLYSQLSFYIICCAVYICCLKAITLCSSYFIERNPNLTI